MTTKIKALPLDDESSKAVGICGGDITAYDLAEALKIEREFDRDLYDLAMTLA